MGHAAPPHFASTIAMFTCAFGLDHVYSDGEMAVLIKIMGDHGMSNRSIAGIVALLRGRPASDYDLYLQDVGWSYGSARVDRELMGTILGRLEPCGYYLWLLEE
jgi:hypothetical protein